MCKKICKDKSGKEFLSFCCCPKNFVKEGKVSIELIKEPKNKNGCLDKYREEIDQLKDTYQWRKITFEKEDGSKYICYCFCPKECDESNCCFEIRENKYCKVVSKFTCGGKTLTLVNNVKCGNFKECKIENFIDCSAVCN